MEKLQLSIATTVGIFASTVAASAQVNICEPLLSQGIYDTQAVMDSSFTISQAKSIVCRDEFETYEGATSNETNIGINVPDYFDGTFGGTTTAENYEYRRLQFCSLDDRGLNAETNSYINLRTINVQLAETYRRCIENVQGAYAYVEPSSDLKKFTIHVKKSGGSLDIVKFTSSPTDIACDAGLQTASQDNPVTVIGSNSFICTRTNASDPIVLSGSTLSDGSLFKRTIEIPGTSASIKNIIDRLASLEGSVTPPGQVAYFTSLDCPRGWGDVPRNWEGRYIVSTVNDAEPRKVVGTALTDGENRATGDHTHRTARAVFTGGDCGSSRDGCAKWGAVHDISRQTVETGGPIIDGVEIRSIAGTNAPYVTLRACIKN